MPDQETVGAHGHKAVVEPLRGRIMLDQPGHHHEADFAGDLDQGAGGWAVRNRLGDSRELRPVEVLEERVTRDRALVEANDLGSLIDSAG